MESNCKRVDSKDSQTYNSSRPKRKCVELYPKCLNNQIVKKPKNQIRKRQLKKHTISAHIINNECNNKLNTNESQIKCDQIADNRNNDQETQVENVLSKSNGNEDNDLENNTFVPEADSNESISRDSLIQISKYELEKSVTKIEKDLNKSKRVHHK